MTSCTDRFGGGFPVAMAYILSTVSTALNALEEFNSFMLLRLYVVFGISILSYTNIKLLVSYFSNLSGI